jgi:hypothetical protein
MTLSADDRNNRLERAISRARKLLDGDFAATAEGRCSSAGCRSKYADSTRSGISSG